jgi:hypothetical protein
VALKSGENLENEIEREREACLNARERENDREREREACLGAKDRL